MKIYFDKIPPKIPNDPSPYGSRTFFTETKDLYTCAECGAKWESNNVKYVHYCPLCGGSLLGKTTKEAVPMPDYVIPFKLSREEAAGKIREAFSRRHSLPQKVRDFTIDEIHGFFLPYWLYDVDYSSSQIWEWRKETMVRRNYNTDYYLAESTAYFEHFTVAANNTFPKEYSQHIEPYHLTELVPYDTTIVSGYYSACFDTPAIEAKKTAIKRIGKIVAKANRESILKVPDRYNPTYLNLHDDDYDYTIPYEEYALLPIWYLRVVNKGQTFIAIVNGQTGKVEIDLPPNRIKYALSVSLLFLFTSLTFVVLFLKGVQSPNPADVDSLGIQYYKYDLIGPYPKSLLYAVITCAIIWLGVLIMFIVNFIKRKIKKHK